MINCLICGNLTNNKKFCSNKCCCKHNHIIIAAKNKKIKKIIKCKMCNKETTNKKFCSLSCSAIYNNSHISLNPPKRQKQPHYCEKCGKYLHLGWKGPKRCNECNSNIKDWSKITLNDFKNGRTLSNYHSRLRSLARKMYNKTDQPKCCSKCGWKHHYEVCHIKPIKDFNENDTISTINNIDNLIALCPNCHWMLDHNLLVLDGSNDLPARSL